MAIASAGGEGDHRPVETDPGDAGQAVRRRPRQHLHPPTGEDQAQAAADHRQEGALGEQLADQAAAGGAQRQPHGDLAPAPGGARQQQTGDVGAGDEQDEGDRAGEQQEEGPGIGHHALLQAHQLDPVVGGVLLAQVGGHRLGLRPRPLEVEPRPQAGDDAEEVETPRRPFGVELERHPDVGLVAEREPAGEHADHGDRLAVEDDGATDDRRIAGEAPLPEAVADHRHPGRRRRLLVGVEQATGHRLHPQHRQQSGRGADTVEPLRLAVPGEVRAPPRHRRHGREDPVLPAPVEVLRVRHRRVGERRLDVANQQQPVGVRIGEGAQQDAVDEAEDHGVGADSQRQRQNRDGGESGTLQQGAGGDAQVVHGFGPPGWPVGIQPPYQAVATPCSSAALRPDGRRAAAGCPIAGPAIPDADASSR